MKAFVYTSSASVVHDGVHDLVHADEAYPVLRQPEQTDFYSHTKGLADTLVLAANRRYGSMLTACIRPAGIFGEGDVQCIPPILNAFYTGNNRVQIGDNTNYFDFTHVGNVAHAHLLAATALLRTHHMAVATPLDFERVDGEAFFVTNDDPYHFWDFARAVWRAAGDTTRPDQIWVIPKGPGLLLALLLDWIYWLVFWGKKTPALKRKGVIYSCMTRTYDITKAKRRLGYQPKVGMDEGIKRSVQSYEAERKEKETTTVAGRAGGDSKKAQ